jgi:hypothetical protein
VAVELASHLTEAIVREQDPARRAFRRRLVATTWATRADCL